MASVVSANTLQTTNLTAKAIPTGSAITPSSDGRLYRPNLPYFIATRNGQGDEGGGGYMSFGNILANRGNWYNANGTATAPEKGLYAFWCKTLTPSNGEIVDLRWYINGASTDSYGAGYSGNFSGHKTMEAFAIFALNKNDTVRVYNINSGTRCCGTHNTYMGYLIGG